MKRCLSGLCNLPQPSTLGSCCREQQCAQGSGHKLVTMLGANTEWVVNPITPTLTD